MQPFIWAEKERYGIEIEETPGCVAEHIAIHRGDRIEALGEHEIAKFMGVGLFFSEAIQERDKISIADRMASLQLTPSNKPPSVDSREILSMSALKVASCVEMMRGCYTPLAGTLVVPKDTAARYKFAQGTGTLVDAMVRDGGFFDVITKAQATTITQGPEGVVVETSDGGTYHGRFGIVTLPMNVMNTVDSTHPRCDQTRSSGSQTRRRRIQGVLRCQG